MIQNISKLDLINNNNNDLEYMNNNTFNYVTFDDMSIKLNELLLIAHSIDPFFQESVKHIFNKRIKTKIKKR